MKNISRGGIYMCNLKETFGSMQKGVRPGVIIQNEIGNRFSPTVIIIPLTSNSKKSLPTHVYLSHEDMENGYIKRSIALCEQIQVIDKRLLVKKMGKINRHKLKSIEEALLVSLGYTA